MPSRSRTRTTGTSPTRGRSERPRLGDLARAPDVLPVAPEDPLVLEPEHGRVGVPAPRERPRVARRSICDSTPASRAERYGPPSSADVRQRRAWLRRRARDSTRAGASGGTRRSPPRRAARQGQRLPPAEVLEAWKSPAATAGRPASATHAKSCERLNSSNRWASARRRRVARRSASVRRPRRSVVLVCVVRVRRDDRRPGLRRPVLMACGDPVVDATSSRRPTATAWADRTGLVVVVRELEAGDDEHAVASSSARAASRLDLREVVRRRSPRRRELKRSLRHHARVVRAVRRGR